MPVPAPTRMGLTNLGRSADGSRSVGSHPPDVPGRTLAHMSRNPTFRVCVAAVAVTAYLLMPLSVIAHPLGNFTINHYAELRIAPERIDVDVVIDMAEIPAFQARQTIDANGDGNITDSEGASWAQAACSTLSSSLNLARDGTVLPLSLGFSAVSFPPGAGGLSTLRLACRYGGHLAAPIAAPTTLTFADTSYAERIGWREIIATGDGTILDTHGLPATSPSAKLTSYPAAMIAQPLDIRSAAITARPIGAAVGGLPIGVVASAAANAAGAVPGGVAAELPDIFRTANLTPLVLLASIASAIIIGAGHALTPGHGKTLMAAYLVGSRGTPVHAVGLGLSVAISHTLGIFVLAVLIVGAQGVLPPDVVVRTTPVIGALSIVAVGGWMLIGELRRRRQSAVPRNHVAEIHGARAAGHAHEFAIEHERGVAHGHVHGADHSHGPGADHGDVRQLHGDHETDGEGAAAADQHSHGGLRHSHVPADGRTLSWRALFVLGLAGGLIPSTAALLILLGSIAAGRPAFGLVLVVAFGLGMAAVMTGVGLVMIFARTRLDRMPSRSSLGRLATAAPLLASIAVLGLGLILSWSAIVGRPIL